MMTREKQLKICDELERLIEKVRIEEAEITQSILWDDSTLEVTFKY